MHLERDRMSRFRLFNTLRSWSSNGRICKGLPVETCKGWKIH